MNEDAEPEQIKQVLVYRRDLKMRKGKIAAQCAHASSLVFFNRINRWVGTYFINNDKLPAPLPDATETVICIPITDPMAEWIESKLHTKIVLSVECEADLLRCYEEAKERGLPTALVTDKGKTEFHGVETHTAVAIGPAPASAIDAITGPGGMVPTKLA